MSLRPALPNLVNEVAAQLIGQVFSTLWAGQTPPVATALRS